jgi:glucan 1,3-beta-glucosidase
VIEAFDQPWKRRLEGTVGGHWGLLDADARRKFPLQGPVPPARDAAAGWTGAALGAAALLVLGRTRQLGGAFLLLAGAALGALLPVQWQSVRAACRDAFECTVGTGFAAAATLAAVLCAIAIARALDGRGAAVPAPAVGVARWLRTDASRWSARERGLGALRFAVLFGAAFVALGLAFDPRYRDFPLAVFAAPTAGYALLASLSSPNARAASIGREERVLAAALLACVPVIVWRETLANVDALAWAGLCLLLGASAGLPLARARKGEQAEQQGDRARLDRVQDEARRPEAGG